MMSNMNHVGVVRANGRKCVVLFRTLPGDAYNCVIIPTESLPDTYHDALIRVVESNAGQSAFHLSYVLERSTLPDGSNMLTSLVTKGFTTKIATDAIEMVPNPVTSIRLSELNQQIAQIQGVSVNDLAVQPDANDENVTEIAQVHNMSTAKIEEPLSDDQLADKYRADAAQLLAEADRLNQMANDINPPTVPVNVTATTSENITNVEEVKDAIQEQAAEVVADENPSQASAAEYAKSNTAANRRRTK